MSPKERLLYCAITILLDLIDADANSNKTQEVINFFARAVYDDEIILLQLAENHLPCKNDQQLISTALEKVKLSRLLEIKKKDVDPKTLINFTDTSFLRSDGLIIPEKLGKTINQDYNGKTVGLWVDARDGEVVVLPPRTVKNHEMSSTLKAYMERRDMYNAVWNLKNFHDNQEWAAHNTKERFMLKTQLVDGNIVLKDMYGTIAPYIGDGVLVDTTTPTFMPQQNTPKEEHMTRENYSAFGGNNNRTTTGLGFGKSMFRPKGTPRGPISLDACIPAGSDIFVNITNKVMIKMRLEKDIIVDLVKPRFFKDTVDGYFQGGTAGRSKNIIIKELKSIDSWILTTDNPTPVLIDNLGTNNKGRLEYKDGVISIRKRMDKVFLVHSKNLKNQDILFGGYMIRTIKGDPEGGIAMQGLVGNGNLVALIYQFLLTKVN